MPSAYVGIGSNLGDRARYIEHARTALASLSDTRLVAFSSIYETLPVGPIAQDAFLNAAAHLQTNLAPRDLLDHLLQIERHCGRTRLQRWGPRTLDLDLLLYDDQVINDSQLTIPHPHLHERWFALKPLADIAPQMRHPVLGKTITELLEDTTPRGVGD